MTDFLFQPSPINTISVVGETKAFPINRIFCVGRNYAAHAAEMGVEVDREAPFYFIKSASSATHSGTTIPYPPGTNDLHHEMELFVAISKPATKINEQAAAEVIYGYGCGLDMTRRDLQAAAKAKQRPWDLGKNFENSAILAPITKAEDVGPIGPQRIHLSVNNEMRQDALLSDMVWNVDEIISDLSQFYQLLPGDIIMTGTPAGVGSVVSGDHITGGIDGLAPVSTIIGNAA